MKEADSFENASGEFYRGNDVRAFTWTYHEGMPDGMRWECETPHLLLRVRNGGEWEIYQKPGGLLLRKGRTICGETSKVLLELLAVSDYTTSI